MRTALKTAFAGFVRTVAAGIIISLVVLLVLVVAFRAQNRQQQTTLDEIRSGSLATVCVLALPVDPDIGRDPEAVQACLERYGLVP